MTTSYRFCCSLMTYLLQRREEWQKGTARSNAKSNCLRRSWDSMIPSTQVGHRCSKNPVTDSDNYIIRYADHLPLEPLQLKFG